MYVILNRAGRYLLRDTLPALWGEAKDAIGYGLHGDAERVINRLWPTTQHIVGCRIVWQDKSQMEVE